MQTEKSRVKFSKHDKVLFGGQTRKNPLARTAYKQIEDQKKLSQHKADSQEEFEIVSFNDSVISALFNE